VNASGAQQGYGLVMASMAVALVLTILPMPAWAAELRPQWLALTVIYWSLAQPERVGVFWAFGAGVLLDVVSGTVLGQNALSLSVVAYLAIELHQRIRIFPVWQQAVSVWLLLLVERLLTVWVLGATGAPTPTLWYWVPSVVGMLLWPWLSAVLRDLDGRLAAR
jgi:rod shape-determining protein MreD